MTGNEKRAPVQGYAAGIPWSLHLRAYGSMHLRANKVYLKCASILLRRASPEDVAHYGGFSTGELDRFVPGWRDEVSEIKTLRDRLAAAETAAGTDWPCSFVQHYAPDGSWQCQSRETGRVVETKRDEPFVGIPIYRRDGITVPPIERTVDRFRADAAEATLAAAAKTLGCSPEEVPGRVAEVVAELEKANEETIRAEKLLILCRRLIVTHRSWKSAPLVEKLDRALAVNWQKQDEPEADRAAAPAETEGDDA